MILSEWLELYQNPGLANIKSPPVHIALFGVFLQAPSFSTSKEYDPA